MNPPNGRTRVSPTANITVTFSEAVDMSSLAGETLRLTNATRGTPAVFVLEEVAPKRVVLDPKRKLAGGTIYTLQISTAARDRAGNALAEALTSTFVVKK